MIVPPPDCQTSAHLVMERTGTFTVHPARLSKWQCANAGQVEFGYAVTLEADDPRLDDHGFLIDNAEIGEFFRERWSGETGDAFQSCELTAADAAYHFWNRLASRGVRLTRCTVRLTGANNTTFTWELRYVPPPHIEKLKQALAAEQAARAAAERERDEYCDGFHAVDEMYRAAVAIFKEQRRVLGVPENDGVSITDHCADLVRRLRVAREALEDIAAMRSWAAGLAGGVWKPDCECGKRLPQIFDKADIALASTTRTNP